ncbi:unnamed protein product [Protopolystoma xenopodis]|uniref:BTB domain-containing protein n=1 Tax=Protopolystoma xenopodis TaxID=117903 RepID=A0A448XA71_9PLAT|nr:unnamed protein product [Protopolystoma xenopodis]
MGLHSSRLDIDWDLSRKSAYGNYKIEAEAGISAEIPCRAFAQHQVGKERPDIESSACGWPTQSHGRSKRLVRIPAHRVVLAAASDYFAAMFRNRLKEAEQSEVWIHEVTPDALKTLIDYIYTGQLKGFFQEFKRPTKSYQHELTRTFRLEYNL